MKLVALLLLMSIMTLGALVEVRDAFGFPIPNATVCVSNGCVKTNATGIAEIPLGVAVEIYLNDMLVGENLLNRSRHRHDKQPRGIIHTANGGQWIRYSQDG
jgi:hypothetical protein